MDHDTEAPEAPAEPPEGETLVERHLAFKRHVIEVFNEWADEREHCTEYERAMNAVGLHGRERYYGPGEYAGELLPLAGEATADEFDRWKARTEAHLYEVAEAHSVNVDEPFQKLGFKLPYEIVDMVIEGTFKVPVTVRLVEGQSAMDALGGLGVQRYVRNAWHTDQVTWKLRRADASSEA